MQGDDGGRTKGRGDGVEGWKVHVCVCVCGRGVCVCFYAILFEWMHARFNVGRWLN